MTRLSAFTAPGRFWRGNLHTHSTNSDGILSPEEVCRRYRAEGYDFLALTDHFVGTYGYPISDTLPYRTNSFTTILGAELHSGAMENGELWHILAVGLPKDFTPSNSPSFVPVKDQETAPQIAARAVAAGAFVAIAHPQWSSLTIDDARSLATDCPCCRNLQPRLRHWLRPSRRLHDCRPAADRRPQVDHGGNG
jgi:predicted metal-dependent phosphoesterase TrpH